MSSDGSKVFVTGEGFTTVSNRDYGTVAYDSSSGDQLWVATYDGPNAGNDYGTALGVSPNGATVFVTGRSRGLGTQYDFATLAYAA